MSNQQIGSAQPSQNAQQLHTMVLATSSANKQERDQGKSYIQHKLIQAFSASWATVKAFIDFSYL